MEELADALVSADEEDAAVAVEPVRAADSAVSVCLVGEPISVAVKSGPGIGSAVAAELVHEPGSSAVKPVGEASI